MDLTSTEWEESLKKAEEEDGYETLWKVFRKSIAITERKNPVCQRNHMPLRYRVLCRNLRKSLRMTERKLNG